MIYDHIEQQCLYRSLHPGFALAFDYLATLSATQPTGRYELDGDRVFVLVQEYTTLPAEGRKYEAHRRYIDIQYLISGEEISYHSPLAALKVTDPYHEEKDFELFTGADEQPSVLTPGSFAIYFPHDAHKPCCDRSDRHPAVAIRKAVVKIRV